MLQMDKIDIKTLKQHMGAVTRHYGTDYLHELGDANMADTDKFVEHAESPKNRSAFPTKPIFSYALWTVQLLLALLFLFAGGVKLILPPEALAGPVRLPVLFLRFIGLCEVSGGLGLILPGLLRIKPGLTPLAAGGLLIIMIGATVITVIGGDVATALIPLVVGILAAFVAYGRWHVVPLRKRIGPNQTDSQLNPVSTGC